MNSDEENRRRTAHPAIGHITMSQQLTEDEVKQRLESYSDPAITDELYKFGLSLVTESLDSLYRLDTKAYAIAGYSGAIFSALFSAAVLSDGLPEGKVYPLVLFLAGAFALVAAFDSLAATKLRYVEFFSPDEWFKKEQLGSPDQLKRYHVLCMYGVRQSHRSSHRKKASHIRRAHIMLCATYIFTLASATPALLAEFARLHTAFNSLGIAVR